MSRLLCIAAALAVLTTQASAYSGGCRIANKIIGKGAPVEASAGTIGKAKPAADADMVTGSIASDLQGGPETLPSPRPCGESPKASE